MRILIGTVEICGWIKTLKDELEKQGHSVTTISEPYHYAPNYKYDISHQNFVKDYISYRIGVNSFFNSITIKSYSFLEKIANKFFPKKLNNYVLNKANNYFFKNTDVFIYFWNGLTTNENDILQFKKNGVKIITWFVGDDVRYYPAMQEEFEIKNKFYEGYFQKNFNDLLRKLRIHEKYSDIIFSVPDQASLALRPYYHLQIPVKIERFQFKQSNNTVPIVVHIPSSQQIKGTAIIRTVINELKNEGLNFIYRELINIPNSQVLNELSNADILVDELFLHGPGVLSFEAMCSGCAVATRYLENSPIVFRPPVVSITEENIKEKLRLLITNNELRNDVIQKGKLYVEDNNKVESIVKNMLSKLSVDTKADYYPNYFRENFEPQNDLIEYVNSMTEFVKDETWYKKNILPGVRNELKF
ncbi:MAG: hypothetical protein K9H41_00415 [Bacteroidia bacterium]|nr:hypothetical protein [Bacteroidia bacterium]